MLTGALPQPAEPEREASLRDFAAVLFRRLPIVLGVFFAALGVVIAVNMTTPIQYSSTARLLVSRGQQESAYTSRIKPLLTWEEELNSEMETIQSGHVIENAQRILEHEKIVGSDGKGVELEPTQVRAATTGKSSVIYVTYTDADPRAAVEGCRALARAYSEFRQQVRAVPEVEKFFREEIEGLREQLEEWEERRADFMNEESVVRISEERTSLIQVRQEIEIDLNRVRADLAETEAKVEVLRERLRDRNQSGVYAFAEADNQDDQVVVALKRELITQRSALFDAESKFTNEHPEVRSLRERVTDLETTLRTELENYLRHIQGKVEVQKAREEAILGELQYLDSELAGFPSKEARLSSFDRVIDQLRSDYQALIDKQIQARIERTGTSDYNVLLLQAAGKPLALRTNDYVRLAIIPLLSLFVGAAMAFVVDGLDHSLKDATEVETHLRLPVLGSVGKLR